MEIYFKHGFRFDTEKNVFLLFYAGLRESDYK